MLHPGKSIAILSTQLKYLYCPGMYCNRIWIMMKTKLYIIISFPVTDCLFISKKEEQQIKENKTYVKHAGSHQCNKRKLLARGRLMRLYRASSEFCMTRTHETKLVFLITKLPVTSKSHLKDINKSYVIIYYLIIHKEKKKKKKRYLR